MGSSPSLALVPESPVAAIVELAALLVERHVACAPRPERGFGHDDAMARLATLGRGWRPATDELTRAIARAVAAVERGPLGPVIRGARLATHEVMVLAALAAIELDDDLARVLASVWGVERRRPEIGLIATLVGGAAAAPVRRALHASAPLVRTRLVIVEDSGGTAARDAVCIADRVIGHLLGDDRLDADLDGVTAIPAADPANVGCETPPSDVLAPAEAIATIDAVIGECGRAVVHGLDGVGKATLVASVAARRGRRALRVDAEPLLADLPRANVVLAALAREALLADIAVVLEVPVAKPPRAAAELLAARLAEIHAPVIAIATRRPEWPLDGVELALPVPGLDDRTLAWLRAMPADVALDADDARAVAIRYAYGAGAIARAARTAAETARRRNPVAPRAELADLSAAARANFAHRLGALAERIPTGFSWSDLVVSPEAAADLAEIVNFARELPAMLDRGWDQKLPYGRGVSAILAGPPGTGKTMAAQLLAQELGYDLFRIDLSRIVDKYIGETEKNLARLFDEAEGSHAILFFDEADALFARRTEVKSSNDRYANLEVNYLLQRMEAYAGTTLLATNLDQGLDPALRRRVRFVVQLDLPDEATRAELWRSMFPAGVELAPIDWAELGRRYEMSGGYIKKAAVRAAAIASARGSAITADHLHAAARAEYRGLGRIA